MSYTDIQEHLSSLYGTKISKGKLAEITDRITPDPERWNNRQLDSVYSIVWLDAIHFSVREDHMTVKKAVYIILGYLFTPRGYLPTPREYLQNIFEDVFYILEDLFFVLQDVILILEDVFWVLQDVRNIPEDLILVPEDVFGVLQDVIRIPDDVFLVPTGQCPKLPIIAEPAYENKVLYYIELSLMRIRSFNKAMIEYSFYKLCVFHIM